jgi:hypothetical protein
MTKPLKVVLKLLAIVAVIVLSSLFIGFILEMMQTNNPTFGAVFKVITYIFATPIALGFILVVPILSIVMMHKDFSVYSGGPFDDLGRPFRIAAGIVSIVIWLGATIFFWSLKPSGGWLIYALIPMLSSFIVMMLWLIGDKIISPLVGWIIRS